MTACGSMASVNVSSLLASAVLFVLPAACGSAPPAASTTPANRDTTASAADRYAWIPERPILAIRQTIDAGARATLAGKLPAAVTTCGTAALERATEIVKIQEGEISGDDPIFGLALDVPVAQVVDCLRGFPEITVEIQGTDRFAVVAEDDRIEVVQRGGWLIGAMSAARLAAYEQGAPLVSSIAGLLGATDPGAFAAIATNLDLSDGMFGGPMTIGAGTLRRDRDRVILEGWFEMKDAASAAKAAETLREMSQDTTAIASGARVELRGDVTRLADMILPIDY
jgi:hypothetical protein